MLKHLGKTRDTNTHAENWFRTTKTVVLRNKLHRRPGDFIQNMEEFISGRMRGIVMTELRQNVTTKQEKTDETHLNQPLSQEEMWQKRTKKKKNRQSTTTPQKHMQSSQLVIAPHLGLGVVNLEMTQ